MKKTSRLLVDIFLIITILLCILPFLLHDSHVIKKYCECI